jgi:hypothetical protein
MKTSVARSDRPTAIAVGALYVVATVAGVMAAVALGSLALHPEALTSLVANESRMLTGAFSELVMAVTVAGIAFMLYPLLMRDARTPVRQGLAVWYLGSRLTEGAIFLVGVLGLLSLFALSRAAADSGAAAVAQYLPLSAAISAVHQYSFVLGQIVFCVGAAMLYYLLLVTKLVPRWLAVWGLVAVPLILIGKLLVPFTGDPDSVASNVLSAPMGLLEMVLAVWLLFRGFNSPAVKEA